MWHSTAAVTHQLTTSTAAAGRARAPAPVARTCRARPGQGPVGQRGAGQVGHRRRRRFVLHRDEVVAVEGQDDVRHRPGRDEGATRANGQGDDLLPLDGRRDQRRRTARPGQQPGGHGVLDERHRGQPAADLGRDQARVQQPGSATAVRAIQGDRGATGGGHPFPQVRGVAEALVPAHHAGWAFPVEERLEQPAHLVLFRTQSQIHMSPSSATWNILHTTTAASRAKTGKGPMT